MQTETKTQPPVRRASVSGRDDSHTSQTVKVYKSCCFQIDKRLLEFIVQVFIATGLLCFCGAKLSTATTCEETSSYWNLLGVLIGWVFKSMIHRS